MSSRSAILLGAVLTTAPLSAAGILRLVQPERYVVNAASQTLRGFVDAPGVSRVEVDIAPFFAGSPGPPRRTAWDVTLGAFQGPIELFPGLNLVTLRNSGRSLAVHYAFFLASPNAPPVKGRWGAQSPVMFVQPKELRVTTAAPLLDGVVIDAAVRSVDVLVLHGGHFLAFKGDGEAPADRLDVRRISVEEGRFRTTVELAPGNNIVLVRPGDRPAPPDTVAVKNLIYERVSPRIQLDEPSARDGRLRLTGRTAKPGAAVTLTGTVLAMDPTTRRFADRTLFQHSAVADAEGRFHVDVPLPPPAEGGVNDFPLIEARMGREVATRTWFDDAAVR